MFPNGVRLVHFIAIPAIGMGLLILAFGVLEDALEGTAGVPGSIGYQIVRTATIAVAMSSLIAWLAFRHRREYETRLYDYYGRPVYWGSGDQLVEPPPI